MDLRLAQTQARMSQAHLAAAAGVSRRTVVRAEGGHPVSGESLRCLRAVLDVPSGETLRPSRVPSPRGILGWLAGEPSRTRALDHASEWAERHLSPAGTLHVGALAWGNGHLWEAQADGEGLGLIDQAAAAPITLPKGRDGIGAGAEAEPLRPTFPLLRVVT